MRSLIGIGLAVAVFGFAAGCGKKAGTSAPGGAPTAAGIEGDWTLVGMEVAGKKMTDADLARLPAEEKAIKATADKLIATKGGKEDPATYKLDATKTPNEIDIISSKDKVYGIYKLEGDTLTICAVDSDNPANRPKEFKTEPKSEAMIMTLKKK